MKDHPILFTGPMVRAILEGRKTQTRRPIKPQPPASWQPTVGTFHPTKVDRKGIEFPGEAMFGASDETFGCRAPFAVGDRLWVREGVWLRKCQVVYGNRNYFGVDYEESGWECDKEPGSVWYATDGKPPPVESTDLRWDRHPSIHMPRWASRITLEVTDIRPERLQAISEADAMAEGARFFPDLPPDPQYSPSGPHCRWSMYEPKTDAECLGSAALAFGNAWNHIYGKGPLAWANNPWVWATTIQVTP